MFGKRTLLIKVLTLAFVAITAGMVGLVWLGAGSAEARGRVTLGPNELLPPGLAADGGDIHCLRSYVEWEPMGSKVSVRLVLQEKIGTTWLPLIGLHDQLMPGKSTGVTVDWPNQVTSGHKYRHIFQLYSVRGKEGAIRNHQLISEYSEEIDVAVDCVFTP